MTVTLHRDGYTLSTDRDRVDVDFVHAYLANDSYWARGRPIEVVRRGIANSLCIGVYQGAAQVGFARVVTDYATFAWLCDVFIATEHRGRGLGKWLIETLVGLEELQGIKTMLLATADAHGLYRAYGGFEPLDNPDKWMRRHLLPPANTPG